VDAVALLARAPQVSRIAFGHLDFQLDLGMRCGPDESELASVRFALVAASRRAQLPPPIDGVSTDTANRERLLTDTQRARAFGFAGKLCIHPAQVGPVNETFSPSASELAWARRVLEGARAHEGRAFSLDGRMVDLPVIRQAERTLQQAP
jgi:citrate lyase subunit beta / citryl-CoA lyase